MVVPVAAAAAGSGGAAAASSSGAAASGGSSAASGGSAGGGGGAAAGGSSITPNYSGLEQIVQSSQTKGTKAATTGQKVESSSIAEEKIAKSSKKQEDRLREIYGKASKIQDILEKVSPMWKQISIVMEKAVTLFLRPIVDFVAKILRPFVLFFWKVSMAWYKWLSKVLGTGSTEDVSDKKKQLEEQLRLAQEAYDEERAKKIKAQLDELEKNTFSLNKLITDLKAEFTKFWIAIGTLATQVASFVKDIWDKYVVKGWEGLLDWGKNLWDTYIVPLGEWFKNLPTKLWDLITGKTPASGGGGGSSGSGSSSGSSSSKSSSTSASTASKATGSTATGGTYMTPSGPVSSATPPASSIFSSAANAQGMSYWSKAAGGDITKSGFYNLHAGETVLNAGQASMLKAGSSANKFSFMNNITINASINGEGDIKALARKLAELQEIELRRRVSYI